MTATRKRRILVVEANPSGHRLNYVRILAQVALADGAEVVLASTPGIAATAEWDLHMSLEHGRVQVVEGDDFSLAALARLARTHGTHETWIPDGDSYVPRLLRHPLQARQLEVTALVMRRFAQRGATRPGRWARSSAKAALRQAARSIAGSRVLTLASALDLSRARHTVRDPVTFALDSSTVDSLRSSGRLDPETFWFAVVGAVDSRKNVDLVAQALLEARSAGTGLLVAGRISPGVARQLEDVRPAMAVAGIPCVRIDRPLLESELDAVVSLADCLVLAHSNDGPSGILGKAAAAGTRVVVAGAPTLCRDVAATPGLGVAVSTMDVQSLGVAMVSVRKLGRPSPMALPEEAEFGRAFLG